MEQRYEYYLECRYDSAKSFCNKAKVRVYINEKVEHLELISYDTLVANFVHYKEENEYVYEYLGKHSQTTTRHQKEFFRQLDLSDKEIEELFKKGRIEIYE
jgi:adenylosuccinate lyase